MTGAPSGVCDPTAVITRPVLFLAMRPVVVDAEAVVAAGAWPPDEAGGAPKVGETADGFAPMASREAMKTILRRP